MKESIAYDKDKKQCLGNYYGDLNYFNYSSPGWIAKAAAENLTAPVSYYLLYKPQVSANNTYDYKAKICQSNETMCVYDTTNYGPIVGGILGGICGLCCICILCFGCGCAEKIKNNKVFSG